MVNDGHQREGKDSQAHRILPTVFRLEVTDQEKLQEIPQDQVLCIKQEEAQVHLPERGLSDTFMATEQVS